MSNRLKNIITSLLESPFDHFKQMNERRKAERGLVVEDAKEVNALSAITSPPLNTNIKFLFSEWQRDEQLIANAKTNKSHVFAFLIERPEFNIYDDSSETQVLFASENKSLCLVTKELLAFDIFEQDPKFSVNMIFKDLQLFTGRLISALTHRLPQAMLLARRQRKRARGAAGAQRHSRWETEPHFV